MATPRYYVHTLTSAIGNKVRNPNRVVDSLTETIVDEYTSKKAATMHSNFLNAENDAQNSVARESDAAILTPRYTTSALEQMGWQLSYGQTRAYREAYTESFVKAWQARYAKLGGI